MGDRARDVEGGGKGSCREVGGTVDGRGYPARPKAVRAKLVAFFGCRATPPGLPLKFRCRQVGVVRSSMCREFISDICQRDEWGALWCLIGCYQQID